MRHRKKKKILDRNKDQRKQLLRNLASSLVKHEKIETTLAKAKFLQPKIEKLITIGKKNNLSTYRRLMAFFQNRDLVKKILNELSPRYLERKGGYTKIIKTRIRKNDGAKMAVIKFV